MFIATNEHTAPVGELEKALSEHLAWLEGLKSQGKVLAYGVFAALDGGFTLFCDLSEAELKHTLEQDPFVRRGLVKYEYREASVVGGIDALQNK